MWKVNGLKWHIDLLRTAQEAVLVHTRDAAPEQYLSAKRANSGNGRAFPDGFIIDVTTDGEDTKTVSLALIVPADLTANPKGIEDFPNLDSYLDAVITEDGTFVIKDFHLWARKRQSLIKSLQPTPGHSAYVRSRFC